MEPKAEQRTYSCSLKTLEEMRNFVESFGKANGIGAVPLSEVVLAVNEAVTNIIEHGGVAESSTYQILVNCDKSNFTITIFDNGNPYDPNKFNTATSGDDIKHRRPRSGMGVYLMRQLVDGIVYNRNGNTNELKLVKFLK